MAQATQSIQPTSKSRNRPAEAELATTVRWLARKEIKAQWARMGRQITLVDATELASATTPYLIQHLARLQVEAQLILSSLSEHST